MNALDPKLTEPKPPFDELALRTTRYRKSKISSLAEKFTRHSPIVSQSNFNLPHIGWGVGWDFLAGPGGKSRKGIPRIARSGKTPATPTLNSSYHVSTLRASLSYSPPCIRAYFLSVLAPSFNSSLYLRKPRRIMAYTYLLPIK